MRINYKIKTGSTWVCLVLLGGMLAGCSSPATQNRRVYDRYAALVAERNRSLQSLEEPQTTTKKSSKSSNASKPVPEKKAAKLKKPTPKKAAPVVEPVPSPPVQVIAPAPALPIEEPVSAPVATPAPVPPASPQDDTGGYRLKVGDGIQIFLRGIPNPDAIEDIIDSTGMISLPLINELEAAGLSASELERRIRKMYLDKDIYRNISVNVVVPTRFYFIQGEIKAPGRNQIMSATRVSQAIAGAGGYTEYASGEVIVKRAGKIVKVIRNSRRLERTPDDDILLEPDDIIEVKRSWW